jgi:chromosome segregation ATPase
MYSNTPVTSASSYLVILIPSFTSDDLQALVSRGIKHSAESSSIRLLTAQAASTDVPAELDRLAALQNELKVCYKLQARKRDALHLAAMAYAETMGSSSYALRARLQELAEITANLDRIAEELYHARDQAAQLSLMLSVHSGSALAMSLRKLHASYLRRVAEMQNLQDKVFDLEAERDEAWAQAQLVARDLDDLNEALRRRDSSRCGTSHPSNRSSLVQASRLSSARVSKAGCEVCAHRWRARSARAI